MPFKVSRKVARRRGGRRYRKRGYKRKGYRNGPKLQGTASLYRPIGFPSNKVVKMRYAEGRSFLVPAATTSTEFAVSANSIFDPYVPSGGHQPMGHDQWAQFYNHYVVIGSRISVTFSAQAGTPGRTMVCCCYIDDDNATLGDWRQLVESGRASYQLIQPYATGIASTHGQKTIGAKYSAKKWFNVKDVKDNVTRIGATFNSNPADQVNYRILMQSTDQLTLNADWYCEVTYVVDYIVLLSEPKDLPVS